MAGSGTAHLGDRTDAVLRVEDLTVAFPLGRRKIVQAVSGVSFDVRKGETLGLVGESGCGKSTTGRAIMQLDRATSGSVELEGVELTTLGREDMRRTRTRLQMIFQDPISSLNPRRRVGDIVAEGLSVWRRGRRRENVEHVDRILRDVGLDPDLVRDRRPHQFSGGQCQRICIARALVLEPTLIICDEPVSALDVSVQAQILNLLHDMKARYGLTLVFIAHDMAVIKNIADRVVVMYLGKTCEVADPDALYSNPAHPYTRILLASIPEPDPTAPVSEETIAGEPPSPIDPPSGCRFRTRCPRALAVCAEREPEMSAVRPSHFVACHNPYL